MNDRLASPVTAVTSGTSPASPASAASPVTSGTSPVSPVPPVSPAAPVLPHHKLIAYSVARSLLVAVLACRIRDAKLRDEAVRSAKSACLDCAEGAGRVTRADKARAFAVARAEAVEAAAAVEIAVLCGDAPEAPAGEVARVADRLVSLLTRLVR